MALTNCKECGHQVSTTAQACPKCGAKVPKGMSLGKKLLYGFLGLVAVRAVIGLAPSADPASANSAPSSSPAQVTPAKQAAAAAPAYSCPEGSQSTGLEMRVTGTGHVLRSEPGKSGARIVNQKATAALKETHYITIDKSTVVRQECVQGEWSRVQVIEPSSLSGTHKGWVQTAVLRGQQVVGGKRVFTEEDFYWDAKSKPHKQTIIAGVNKIHSENARCAQIDPSSAAVSSSKGTKADPVFYVTCGEGAGVFNVFFSKSEVAAGTPMTAAQHIERVRAADLCERYVKSHANHPSTVDFSRVMDLQVIEHPNGRTTLNSTFTAKNSLNLETKHKIRCLLDKRGLIEGHISEDT